MDQNHALTVTEICEAIGRRRISDEIQVRPTAVSNAVSSGKFPASWFDVIDRLCGEAGLACPRHLFTFVGAGGSIQRQDDLPPPAASAAKTPEGTA